MVFVHRGYQLTDNVAALYEILLNVQECILTPRLLKVIGHYDTTYPGGFNYLGAALNESLYATSVIGLSEGWIRIKSIEFSQSLGGNWVCDVVEFTGKHLL